jgi:hypothetical protein
MSLEQEIQAARKKVVTDGYEMSIGEIMNLYRDNEIKIKPDFQRLFRWNESQKTRFIESILLGIPIPPIFVYSGESGVWELVDGLQRLSTIFEFAGILKTGNGDNLPGSILEGTKLLPSLSGKRWHATEGSPETGFSQDQQLAIKRSRLRVEILKQESDPWAKYELFQRLNTGGSILSPQEVRSCVMVMINMDFYQWIGDLAHSADFSNCIDQTETAEMKQQDIELALRFLVYRRIPYRPGMDVHEYLDDGMMQIASNPNFPYAEEKSTFEWTFERLNNLLGSDSFKRWDGNQFGGKFLMSVFEVVATGISSNRTSIELLGTNMNEFIISKVKNLWGNDVFIANSGAGIRGTTRLAKLLPLAQTYFRP